MTAATKLARTTIEIEPEEVMHVLYVEHDHEYRTLVARRLQKWGCRVDAVSRPFEAVRLLEPDKYQMVIVDIGFNPPDISGDEFLVQNRDMLEGSKAVALTGQRLRIKHWEDFESMGVRVVNKGEEIEELREVTESVFSERREVLVRRLNQAKARVLSGHSATTQEYPLAAVALEELQQDLLSELGAMGNKDERVILFKGRKYSVNDLIQEIEDGTDVGRAHVRMMLNLRKNEGTQG